jgi:4-amino-4-deoxychorismate lyase
VHTRYILGPEGSIDCADRGLAYGDGLFETIAVRKSEPQRIAAHLERLGIGCERLGIPAPDDSELLDRLASAASGIDRGVVKLILTRGTGPRGYAPPPAPVVTVILNAAAAGDEPPETISVATLDQRLGENPALAGIKHLCRLEQVLGQLELQSRNEDEGLMLSLSGKVIGGTSRNLFAVFGRMLVTPDVTRAGILGVMRRAVLDQCKALDLRPEEREIAPSELAGADELFMTNALVGIQSVSRLDDQPYACDAVACRFRRALDL